MQVRPLGLCSLHGVGGVGKVCVVDAPGVTSTAASGLLVLVVMANSWRHGAWWSVNVLGMDFLTSCQAVDAGCGGSVSVLAYGNNELDPGSARKALGFKQIMDATPMDLKSGMRNIYSQIAIALKGGELRDVGLANLAAQLVKLVPRLPIVDDPDGVKTVSSRSCSLMNKTSSRSLLLMKKTSSRSLSLVKKASSVSVLSKRLSKQISSLDELSVEADIAIRCAISQEQLACASSV